MELLYSAVIILTVLETIHGLRCRSCHGIIDPKYCAQTTECSTGEFCYTEQVVDDTSTIFYNLGCKSSQLCGVAASNIVGKRSQLHLCEKCCKYDKCNSESCFHVNSTHVDKCFNCSHVRSPIECQTTTVCLPDEMCFTQEFVNNNLEKAFRLGCEKKKRCEILHQLAPHQRSTQLCNQCCENDKCNKFLCGGGELALNHTVAPMTTSIAPNALNLTTNPTMTAPNETTTQRLTTPDCVDSTVLKCAEIDASGTLCSGNNAAASKYCPKYCKLC